MKYCPIYLKSDTRTVTMVTPADGPSLPTAPAGKWICTSVRSSRSTPSSDVRQYCSDREKRIKHSVTVWQIQYAWEVKTQLNDPNSSILSKRPTELWLFVEHRIEFFQTTIPESPPIWNSSVVRTGLFLVLLHKTFENTLEDEGWGQSTNHRFD